MKRNYHSLDNRGKVNERKLAQFLAKNGQQLLPMVELVEQSPLPVDELVHTVGRVTVRTACRFRLSRSARRAAAGRE